jgi:hypothetical protein
MDKTARIQEIYRRGLQDKLPPEKRAIADELIRRGVVKVETQKKLPGGTLANIDVAIIRGIQSEIEEKVAGITQLIQQVGLAPVEAGLKRAGFEGVADFVKQTREESAKKLTETVEQRREQRRAELPKGARKFETGGKIGASVAQFGFLGEPTVVGAGAEGIIESTLKPAETIKGRVEQATIGGLVSAGTVGTIKTATKAIPVVAKAVKKGVQKSIGLSAEKLQDFANAGIKPTLADVSISKPTQAFQNLLQRIPGASGKIVKSVQKQADDIGNKLIKISDGVGGTEQEAGVVIKQGTKRFIDAFQNKANKLYGKLNKFVGDEEIINFKNVDNLLEDFETKNFLEAFPNTRGSNILKRVQNVFINQDGKIPHNQFRSLRSLVGRNLSSYQISGDERRILSRIYGAMTEDLKNNLSTKGDEALRTFNTANKFFARRTKFINESLNKINEQDIPEKVFKSATSGLKSGGSDIRKIMQILNLEEKQFVRGTLIKRLGKATASQQDATGQLFSPNSFLTRWNQLAPEARNAIFNPVQRNSIENLNKVMANMRATSQTVNTSKNLPYAVWLGLGGLAGTSGIPSAVGAVGGARITAEMFTNPRFINWLSQSSKITTPAMLTRHLDKLGLIASKNPEIREDIANYLESITIREEQ